ncbi:MAG TPA: pyridoxamine 5'-phosphate oxidase family protein [Solirubrobacteraceae bacterium]
MGDLSSFLGGGLAVIVATADEQLHPEISRGWGPQLAADEETLTLCVAAAPASRTRANLARGGMIAATFSVPTTYRTVQLKGPILGVDEPTAAQLARADEHLAAFSEQVVQVGIPPGRAARFREAVLLAVRMGVRERYEQTPGPKAGTPL